VTSHSRDSHEVLEDALFEKAEKSDRESKGITWGESEGKQAESILSKVPRFMRVARALSFKSKRRSSIERDVRSLELSARERPMDNPLALGLRHEGGEGPQKASGTGTSGLKIIGKNQAEIDKMKSRIADLQMQVSRHKKVQEQVEKRAVLSKNTAKAAKGGGKKLVGRVDARVQNL